MAELVRQVEVHCSERAHAIAFTWNAYTAAMDASLRNSSSSLHSPYCSRISLELNACTVPKVLLLLVTTS